LRGWTVALFLLIAITLGAFGQISLKYGMKQFGALGAPGASMVGGLARAIITPYVLLGLCLYAVSSGFWLVVLSKWALSYAYPMIATNYLLVVLLSRAFFRENVLPLQWVGIVLMVTGLVLVAGFGAKTG
jgi:uncharacterized membrane protein